MAESHESPPGTPPPLPGRRRKLILWLAVLLLVLPAPIAYIIVDRLRGTSGATPQVIASYQADYQPNEPTAPWRYLWNAVGPIGETTNYSSLRWDGRRYAAHITPEWPRPAPARYMRLTEAGGHPGQGMGQGWEVDNHLDRFVIAAFTVAKAGPYWITNSSLGRNDAGLNGSIHLQVFINNQEIGPLLPCRTREGQSFDRALGTLKGGDTIYVAVGPNEMDTNDSFGWDFSIAH